MIAGVLLITFAFASTLLFGRTAGFNATAGYSFMFWLGVILLVWGYFSRKRQKGGEHGVRESRDIK